LRGHTVCIASPGKRQKKPMKYIFQLGNHPNLSRAEIEHVFLTLGLMISDLTIKKTYALVTTDSTLDIETIMNRLGGTLAIAEAVAKVEDTVQTVADYLDAHVTDKIFFSLHADNAKKLGIEVKKELKSRGRSVRYIEAGNTATILHNNLIKRKGDLILIDGTLFVTRAIQPIEAFGERDFGRPSRDSKSGMLPPKLAQIMINLSGAGDNDVLLDPFCGSGTILMEASLMGFKHIIGADLSEQAISDTRKNIDWLANTNTQSAIRNPGNIALHTKDVRHLTEKSIKTKVNAIVTEPFMGKPIKGTEPRHEIEMQARDLASLYTASFETFKKIIVPGGSIVFIIPQFMIKDEWITVNCLNSITNLGFTQTELLPGKKSLLYHRKNQHVGRMIYRFEA